MIHRPKVLVLDEPTVGLDPRQIVDIRSLIKSLGGSTTILLSTHILPEVSMTCERVMIIDYGRIIAEDTADGLTRRLQGSDETRARVAGPRAARAAGARAAARRRRGAARSRGSDGVVTVVIVRSTARRRRCAARSPSASSQSGWGLLEIRPLPMSLEDLFVRLVRSERDAAA